MSVRGSRLLLGNWKQWSRSASRSAQRAAVASPDLEAEGPSNPDGIKPFSLVPGEKGLPIIGNLLNVFKKSEKGHISLGEAFDTFGPIFKTTALNITFVMIRDIEAVEKMHRLEGKYPRRISVGSWIRWRDENQHAKGILIEDGPEWKRMRALLDKRMMRPRHVATYLDCFNEVVTDFVDHLREIREKKGNGVTVPNLDHELFHWSLETIGTVLYETRFGSFAGDRDPAIAEFIEAVHGIFRSTEKVIYFPSIIAKIVIPKWFKMHDNAWRTIFSTGKRLIDKKMTEISERLEKGEEIDGFLPAMISDSKLTREELYANISELMLGAVDTTSNTMQWVLHQLSEQPEAQEKMYREVMEVTGGDICNTDHLQKLVYLKAFIKEVLRLYPIAGVVTRVLNNDLELCGYNIPKDTTVIASTYWMARDPDLYEDPEEFRPERWLRDRDNGTTKHNFAWLPFGFGPRMCIGRRVAELEMYLLTSRIIQNFEIRPTEGEPVEVISRGLLVPSRSVNVQFIDRT